ncbi:Imm7 family immunity protein [Butyrivibrio sp. INlla14]|uniref:Imm7 family immunity protein n=1 Tax=Butyrivibrio sp. INlla14 TaxID=1520808 RepID=UPI0008760577|nr:Imm7 family immunity protein [Butyrivibrio sp. INlla14]SCY39560.1 Immunity protein 7 [Butyrivibrio sp. INlla14]
MIEIQAWLTIWATHLNEDVHTEINEEEIYAKVEQIVSNLKYNKVDIIKRNGPQTIHMTLCDNRKTEKSEELIAAFNEIAEVATGSYGMLYYWDDEDPEKYDDFQVLVARKGKTEWKKDEYLSPQSTMIFDDLG